MTAEVVCTGEAIIDFRAIERGSLKDVTSFHKSLGGAPANVAIGLSRLGTKTAFIGGIGDDPFGKFIVEMLSLSGVLMGGVRIKKGVRTRLAFVSVDGGGERDFSFWESRGADVRLTRGDIDWQLIAGAKILHLSSFMLLTPNMAGMLFWMAKKAREFGTVLSFDPNIRMDLWPSQEKARYLLRRVARQVGVFRCNLDEARFITGVKTIEGAADSLLDLGPALVVITHGAKGCYFQTAKARKHVAGFSVVAKDTTACGDGFMAGLLHGLSQEQADVSTISEEKMVRICQKANAIGALVATTEGAAMSMPTGKVVDRFLMIENY